MKVFEGSRVPDYPTEKAEVKSGIAIPIGEPIKVDAPLVLNLSRKKTAGIAVIGTRSDMMKQVAGLILLGALRGDNVKIHYADGDILVEETPDALTLELLKEREEDAEILSTRADIVRCVDKLYELYRKRRKGEDESSESHVLFVNHTQNVDIVKMMLKNFDDHLTEEMKKGIDEENLSIYQFVTLASLIEKEAKYEKDRPLIASVFLNRLDKHMKLQSDASISYAMGTHKAAYSIAETRYDSPYNTYMYEGLPPGPIGNPGMDCMNAVLKAPHTSYLYFVADEDGHNYFATTYEEHMKNVEEHMP